jgi:hypothetical protein
MSAYGRPGGGAPKCWAWRNRRISQQELTKLASRISLKETIMRMAVAIVISAFFATSALAQGTCDSQAVGKDGKPLSGAAKTAFVNKCKKDACEPKAVGSDGKPLAGAAKASFMKKCQNDA